MTVSYVITDGAIGIPPINVSGDTTQRIALGQYVVAQDATYGAGDFIYVKFTGTVAAGDFVVVDRYAKTCTQSPASATKGDFGIAMAAQASGQYGFVMVRGIHDAANVATASLSNPTALTGSGTAGRATTGTANYILEGVWARGNAAANVGPVELYWPTCSGR